VGEVGILFLLFEQGLELSLKRLRALAKYAFGLGLLQIGKEWNNQTDDLRWRGDK
jgi:Kef-type K+ transport system membrane component KefB